MNEIQQDIFDDAFHYQPRRPVCFDVQRIVLAKGWDTDDFRRNLTEAVCRLYPHAQRRELSQTVHTRVPVLGEESTHDTPDALRLHEAGKRTLVFGEHLSSVRFSDETENTCPNYWHYSFYGFCPYGCAYCYLTGTPGVRFSPTVKIFLNVHQTLEAIRRIAAGFTEPTTFYHGKLQDALALDPLTGYSQLSVPFFARQKYARQVMLTKSTDVENLLPLEHEGRTILSWTVNLPEISRDFEPHTPAVTQRIEAMKRAAAAGYPVRAVLMPIIPVDGWVGRYAEFLESLVRDVPLERLTIGAICSYPFAVSLMNRKLGCRNAVNENLSPTNSRYDDGRRRYPSDLRAKAYRHFFTAIRRIQQELEIGLCLETRTMLDELADLNPGKCNCVW